MDWQMVGAIAGILALVLGWPAFIASLNKESEKVELQRTRCSQLYASRIQEGAECFRELSLRFPRDATAAADWFSSGIKAARAADTTENRESVYSAALHVQALTRDGIAVEGSHRANEVIHQHEAQFTRRRQ